METFEAAASGEITVLAGLGGPSLSVLVESLPVAVIWQTPGYLARSEALKSGELNRVVSCLVSASLEALGERHCTRKVRV